MNRIDTFISCLNEWNDSTIEKATPLDTITFELGYVLGLQNPIFPTLEEIKNRIVYLIDEEKIDGKFLIYSLISNIDLLLENVINNLGSALISNTELKKSFDKNSIEIPEELSSTIEKLKSKSHLSQAERQLDNWRKIKYTHFTITNEHTWTYEDFQQIKHKA